MKNQIELIKTDINHYECDLFGCKVFYEILEDNVFEVESPELAKKFRVKRLSDLFVFEITDKIDGFFKTFEDILFVGLAKIESEVAILTDIAQVQNETLRMSLLQNATGINFENKEV